MKNQAMKIKVALLFGGKSTEHDISVISALQAYNNINKEKYDVFPIYVTRENELFWAYEIEEAVIGELFRMTYLGDEENVKAAGINVRDSLAEELKKAIE